MKNMARGNASNLVDPARRKKMNNFYKKDLPLFMEHTGKASLNNYEKSFIMKRAWAAVDGEHDAKYAYSTLAAYIKTNKPAIDKRAAASAARREKKKEVKKEKAVIEKKKAVKKKAAAKK